MNNYQWLLQMDGADRKAWFDAEHVETEERALDGDTEPENEDSRELLEADVFKAADDMEMFYNGERFIDTRKIIGWLDRQAAITEEQTRCKWVTASADEIAAWRSKAEKLKAQVYELTAERGKIAELVGWRGEVDGNSGRPLLVPMVAAMCEGSEVAEKLRVRVEELTAERDELKAKLNYLKANGVAISEPFCGGYEVYNEVMRERDELKGQVFTLKCECDDLENERDKLQEQLRIGWECECRLQAERERYREKFGKCLDYADAIHALMDDEGMA